MAARCLSTGGASISGVYSSGAGRIKRVECAFEPVDNRCICAPHFRQTTGSTALSITNLDIDLPAGITQGLKFPTWQSPQIQIGGPCGTLPLAGAASHS